MNERMNEWIYRLIDGWMNGKIDKWIGYGVVLFKHYAINGLSTHNQERFFSDCFYAYYFFFSSKA